MEGYGTGRVDQRDRVVTVTEENRVRSDSSDAVAMQ